MRALSPWTSMASLERSFSALTFASSRAAVCARCAPITRPALPARTFSSTPLQQNWLMPKSAHTKRDRKGRPRVPTGGSTRGTTVVWGDFGLRLLDHHRRISAAQLRNGEETIKKRLRGMKYRLYTRISANIGVCKSGNETRMGKGKGSFDHWASRVAISKVIFEIKGEIHEQIIRDAFRLAGNKLPGTYEFVRKSDPPVMGIAKVATPALEGELRRPRKAPTAPNLENTASRLPSNVQQIPPVDPTSVTPPASASI